MAPWPVQGNEPKSPDKDEKREQSEPATKADLNESSESTISTKGEQKPDEKEVLTLDEGQLKALLDEAITYKNPKDREGKSELFKELLQEAEADENDSKGLSCSLSGKLPRAYNLPARRRQSRHSGGQGRECGVGVSSTRGGSLQNLHALGMEGGRRSRRTLVSARQREGGSLPSDVNVDNDGDLDMICPNYTSRATLEVSGPSMEETPSTEEQNAPSFVKVQGHTCLPNGTEQPNTKEEELVVEAAFPSSLSVGPVESGAMLYPTTPVQHVSVLSIPPSQIHAGSDDHRISDSSESKKLNVSRSRQHKKAVLPHQLEESDNTSEGLLGLPLTAYWNRYSSFTLLDFQDANTRVALGTGSDSSKPKPVDENGNALACVRMDSNCVDKRKQRRVKAKNDRNTILSDEIEGFRGGADIDSLMEYIESPSLDANKANKPRNSQANGARNSVKLRAKEEEPRTLKRKKEKFQRCNSLEEISKTKLEDLTEETSYEKANGSNNIQVPTQKVTVDDTQLADTPSWEQVVETSQPQTSRHRDIRHERLSPDTVQDTDFHVVTKKQRKKKKRPGCGSRRTTKPEYYASRQGGSSRLLYQYRREQDGQPRRKSASSVPPSDKSDSSDLDSVHSLPVSSSTSRTRIKQNSASGDTTPQASYADIARIVSSPPAGIQAHYPSERSFPDTLSIGQSVTLPLPFASFKDAATEPICDKKSTLKKEDYPPLEVKNPDLCTETLKRSHQDFSVLTNSANKSLNLTVIQDNDSKPPESVVRRPPVILMNDSANVGIPELQFGFEINYQLLQSDEHSINVAPEPLPDQTPIPPQNIYSAINDPNVVQYLTVTWDEAMEKVRNGKFRFYDGQ